MHFKISDRKFPDEAWKAVEERKPFSFTVNGRRSQYMKKAITLFKDKIYKRSSICGKKEWINFSFYALLTPICWSVIFTAINNGMRLSCYDDSDSITVCFEIP